MLVTDNGIRLLSLRGTARALDINGNGGRALLRNLQSKWIQPYLSDQLKEWILWATNEKIKQIDVPFGPAIIPFKASSSFAYNAALISKSSEYL